VKLPDNPTSREVTPCEGNLSSNIKRLESWECGLSAQQEGEFTMPNRVLSTGVLIRDPASFNANVTVVNTGATTGQTAKVEIFDWGVEQVWSKPTPMPVSPSTAVAIGAHTQQDFIALITQSTAQPTLNLVLYEIRITLPTNSPLLINCFAINGQGSLVAANTVLHAQLVAI
jgi:hypothetical protein